jgi:UDP-N-acetylmuramoylalanine--D-glutamate ligase
VIFEKTKNAVLLKGKATDKILENLAIISSEKRYPVAQSMEEALNLARGMAEKGDVVLLSPGAASFGIFQNEFDRGYQFRELVKKIG